MLINSIPKSKIYLAAKPIGGGNLGVGIGGKASGFGGGSSMNSNPMSSLNPPVLGGVMPTYTPQFTPAVAPTKSMAESVQGKNNVYGAFGQYGDNYQNKSTPSPFGSTAQSPQMQTNPAFQQQNQNFNSNNPRPNIQSNNPSGPFPQQNLQPRSGPANNLPTNPHYGPRPNPNMPTGVGFSASQIAKIQSHHQANHQANPQRVPKALNSKELVSSYEQYNANNPTINFPGIKNTIQEGFQNQRPNPNLSIKNKDSISYLSTLSPQELKKEVVKTEIEIQKSLIESEKNYRQDVSTIRDLISPSSISITTSYMEVGTKLVRSFFVLTYSRIITSGWLEGIINADIPLDLSIFIYPESTGDVIKDLKSKVAKIQASLQINAEKGQSRDPALETAYRDVEALRDAIQQGVENFFKIGVYVQIYGDTIEQLEKHSQFVESVFDQQNIILKRSALQMDDGFNSCLPILKDDLYVYSNMNTSPLSACFPFISSDLSSNDGILYGINRHNSSLIIYDRFDLENANCVVFATTGAGKSYAVKLEVLRSLMMGTAIIIIDPEQEYKMLCDTVGGAYVNFSLNSNNRINPFDLPKAIPGENNTDILRSAVIDMIGLINIMIGKMNPQETSIMEKAIIETYAKKDITPEANFDNITPPTMSDLVEILNGIVGGDLLAQKLYRYTDGTFAGIFNKPTNINAYNEFVVFNIRDLQDELRPIAMYILLKYVWNEIRSQLKKRILVVDEAWIMMQYEDSAKFLYGLVKRARKYYLGVTTITQDVTDFLGSSWGKPIVTNSALKMLLKQSPGSIEIIGQTFNLTTGEKQVLLDSEIGQGIFFAGSKHVAISILAFPTEHRVITTNPKDILKMQGLDEQAN
jgi:conjugal transfer ATP-binding protein TraC